MMRSIKVVAVFALVLLLAGAASAQYTYELSDWGRLRVFSDADQSLRTFDRISFQVAVSETNVLEADEADGAASYMVDPPEYADEEYATLFNWTNPEYAEEVTDMPVLLTGYGWTDEPFYIYSYQMTNNTGVEATVYPGLEIIPQIADAYGDETADYDSETETLYISKGDEHFAFRLLNLTAVAGAHVVDYADYEGATNTNTFRYTYMSDATVSGFPMTSSYGTLVYQNGGEVTLTAGQDAMYFLAVAWGADQASADLALADAVMQYETSFLESAEEPAPALPTQVELGAAYPNPFNPATTVPFELNAPGTVDLAVFNSLGQRVATLASGQFPVGEHSASWLAADEIRSGVYVLRISVDTPAGTVQQARRVTLLK